MKIRISVRGRPGPDRPCRLDAVLHRHRVVEDDHIGLQGNGGLDRLLPVRCLTHHLEAGLLLEDRAQAGPDHLVVVRDEDAGHATRLFRRWSRPA